MKDDLQGYSNFRRCVEAEEKLTVALRYVLVIVVKINVNYICTILNAIKIQRNLKGNYTRKSKSYTKLKQTIDIQTQTHIPGYCINISALNFSKYSDTSANEDNSFRNHIR